MGGCCNAVGSSKGDLEEILHELSSKHSNLNSKKDLPSINSFVKDNQQQPSINLKPNSVQSLSLSRSMEKSMNITMKSNFSDKLAEIKRKAMNSIIDEMKQENPFKLDLIAVAMSKKELNLPLEAFEDRKESAIELESDEEEDFEEKENDTVKKFLEMEDQEMKNRKKRESKTDENLTKFTMKISPDIFIQLKKGSISDNYHMGDALGEGTYGKVSVVTHLATGIVRAMKTIRKNSLLYEDEQKIFAELTILKSLDHPNILKLFELYQDDKNYYLITEYCSGGELFQRIKTSKFFSEKKAADYLKQLLSAVVYCHSQKIVHRDLKPENLLFASKAENASLKVIDFGTARKFEGKKMSKRVGTVLIITKPYYIAPEVLRQSYDERCDVWSCGVILYIMLCGYPPYGGRSEEEIFKKIQRGSLVFDR